jgi:hypothetical protein
LTLVPQEARARLSSKHGRGRGVELTMDDFVPQVEKIISVGEFYEKPPAARSSSPRNPERRQAVIGLVHAVDGGRQGNVLRSWPAARQGTTS